MMEDQAIALIKRLPPTIGWLRIWHANFGKDFMDAVSNHVKNLYPALK